MRYELYRYSGGKWGLDSIFDDRTIALDEAHALVERGRAPYGLKLVEDDDTSTPRTIFRHNPEAEQRTAHSKRQRAIVKEVEVAREERKAKKEVVARPASKRPPTRNRFLGFMALRLVLILIGGAVALHYLRVALVQ